MALWHGYLAAENLAMNEAQKDAFVDRLRGLGQDNGGAAQFRMQLRPRNDGQAAIFEAKFNDAQLTPAAIKQFLASIFGVSVASISHAVGTAGFGSGTTQYVTFTRTGIDYLRVAAFGGTSASWEQSKTEAQAYLALNSAEWNEAA
jgi:hypothetical protein